MKGSLIISGYNFYQVLIATHVHFWQRIKYEFVSSSNVSLRIALLFYSFFSLSCKHERRIIVRYNFDVLKKKSIYIYKKRIIFK